MMLRRFRTFAVLLLAAGMLAGCRPDLDFMLESFVAPAAEVSGTSQAPAILFSAEEGQATIVFHSTGRWTASFVNERAADWCLLPSTEGRGGTVTIYVRVRANQDYDERSASILFTCDDVQRTLVVTQKQRDALLLSPGRVEMPQAGGQFDIEVKANIDYQVIIPSAISWLHDVGTKGLVTTVHALRVDPNDNLDPRQAYVTVNSSLGSEEVVVFQAGEAPTLVLSAREVEMPAEGGSFDVQVTSNLDVEIVSQPASCDWVGEVQTKAVSTNTYYFAVAPNESREDRSMSLVFRNQAYKLSDTVHVHQAYMPILLSDSSVELPGREVGFSVMVAGTQPEEYRITLSDRWLWLDGLKAGDGHTLVDLHVQEPAGTEARVALILLERKGIGRVDTVTVTQFPLLPGFSFVTQQREVTAPVLGTTAADAWILWGDGSFERYVPDLTHRYAEPGRHTVWVEGRSLTPLRIPAPEDGMKIDFSQIKGEDAQ